MTKLEPMSWAAIGLSEPDRDSMWSRVAAQLKSIGFEQPGLVLDKPFFDRTFPKRPDLVGNVVSAEWEEHFGYTNSDEYTGVSAASSVGRNTLMNPEVLLASDLSFDIKQGIGELYECGLVRGWNTPVRNLKAKNVAILLLATSDDGSDFDRLLDEHRRSLQMCVSFLIEGRDVRKRVGAVEPRALLSARERECLSWASLGFSSKQISDRLKLSEATVNEYLSSAATKLGATNRAQAVARAVMLEMVDP